ncbi:MAG: class I SAM-dependent RNA methyltransferase [Hyphomicrobiaceae bacterium]
MNIVRLGAHGDGVTEDAGDPQFVPFALPGERWRQTGDGGFERLSDAPGRVVPPCPHYGTCGGCVAQHMSETVYTEWKTNLVRQAFAHHGITSDLRPLWRAPPGSRRRVTFSVAAADGRIRFGFREARSHTLVEIKACTIAAAEIVDVLPVLGTVLAEIANNGPLPSDTRLHVMRADNGIDVLVSGVKKTLSAAVREKLAGVADQGGILRLIVGNDEIFQSAHPVLQVAGADLRLPAGVFTQAVAAAETAMAVAVVKALGRAKRVADLFCGLGTFALPIAKRARVVAIDNQSDAVAALAGAVRHAQGLKPVECVTRDLFREPLSRNELKAFDAVVFDPPRAGAIAQSEALARSKVPCVVAVSCNPATLARDLRILIDGGYTLHSVLPIDQFLFSAHVEAIAVLRR